MCYRMYHYLASLIQTIDSFHIDKSYLFLCRCQHTFCKNCIVTLKSDSRNNENCISCPICRETHILTNGVEGLPANYTMKRLIELEAMAAAEKAEAEAKMKQTKAKSR